MPGLDRVAAPLDLDATAMLGAFRRGELSPLEVFEAATARLGAVDRVLNAFHFLQLEAALDDAQACTDELARGEWRGPLHGIPIGVKELFDVAGLTTCFGSTIFADRVPRSDAAAVGRLRAAGAIVLGNTRSHEFGWGITTQHHSLPSTRNPRNTAYVPGGSSGGSAAAVAAGIVPVAIGSDTGGSIRIPAAFCGVVGFKPSYGRVSLRGACPLAPSLDHGGALTTSVRDAALVLSVLAGYDVEDPATWRDAGLPLLIGDDVRGRRAALVPDLHLVPLAPEVGAALAGVAGRLEAAGVEVVEESFPDAAEIRATFAAVQMAEAHYVHTEVLRTFPARAGEYGADVRGRLEQAAGVTTAAYVTARERARRFRRQFEALFERVDALVLPVHPGPPARIESPEVAAHLGDDVPLRDLVMPYTVPQDLAGLPAVSVPAGHLREGLPIGVQVVTAPGADALALALAAACTT